MSTDDTSLPPQLSSSLSLPELSISSKIQLFRVVTVQGKIFLCVVLVGPMILFCTYGGKKLNFCRVGRKFGDALPLTLQRELLQWNSYKLEKTAIRPMGWSKKMINKKFRPYNVPARTLHDRFGYEQS
jgi:hypothetical protein